MRLSLTLFGVAAAALLSGCATTPKNLEPVKTPPPKSQLLAGLDVVQQPELEADWADFVKQRYPLWRQHYWVDRGQWGNRGYLTGTAPSAAVPAEAILTPQPVVLPQLPPVTIVPDEPKTVTIEPAAPKKEPVKAKEPTTYVVKKGDCLWRIAGRVYGNPFKWPKIYHANEDKIKNPNRIYPNQVLTIPHD